MPTKTPTKKSAPKKAAVAKKAPAVKKAVAPKVVAPKPVAAAKPAASKPNRPYLYANGKRKTSVATVRLYSNGSGDITVNDRAFMVYFPVITDREKILAPLRMAGNEKGFDVTAEIMGGGIHSQAEALRHGISKALLAHDPALRTTLKHAGFLTRDSRVKERKKYGLRRARRAPQFSKR